MPYRPWRDAMQDALYGDDGFFRHQPPAHHFRTSPTAGPAFAAAVRVLAGRVDEALGRPDPFDVVDVGAGRGELLAALPDVPTRWRLTGVEIADDPRQPDVGWRTEVPPLQGLLLANEWLDAVPVDVLFDGRVVEVDADGSERLGAPAAAELLGWAERWWPNGRRVEVGRSRDRAWAAAVAQLRRGLAVAIDYAHVQGDLMTWGDRRPTLTGYRDGRQVLPLPDGSCDLTAHVAMDAVLAAGGGGRLLSQRAALLALGVDGTPPDRSLADDDPRGYLRLLAESSARAELLSPRGLGAFCWLVHAVGIADPL